MRPKTTDWLDRLARLRVDRDATKGIAPHKPLLLLAVLELLEAGLLTDGWVTLSPDLILRFQNFWPIVAARRSNRGDVRMPFHALATDGVWNVYDRDGRPSRARATSERALLPNELLALVGEPVSRNRIRRLLVTRYFPADEQIALLAALGMEEAAETLASPVLEEQAGEFHAARATGRSARFKNLVVSGYRFTCALTGYRLVTSEQLGIVEAAHIHAFRDSRDDTPDNGLALSPTAHALFDLGLWSVDDHLRILVKQRSHFTEDNPTGGFLLRPLAGRTLALPDGGTLRPSQAKLAWHRREHGFAA